MDVLRLGLYLVGALASLLLAGRLLSGRHTLSKMFGGMMVAWAVNCVVFGALLLFLMAMGELPEWTVWIRLLNAFLLAVAPLSLCIWFMRANHASN